MDAGDSLPNTTPENMYVCSHPILPYKRMEMKVRMYVIKLWNKQLEPLLDLRSSYRPAFFQNEKQKLTLSLYIIQHHAEKSIGGGGVQLHPPPL